MDVTQANFTKALPKILSAIEKATFIAIDTEFTGLSTDKSLGRSYFDSGSSLYEKESKNLEDVSICQIGISIFKNLLDCNKYVVSSYNIFVRPQSILSIDENILFQTSSIDFLRCNGFDFNKWVFEGVPCLNSDQETEVRQRYKQTLEGQAWSALPYEVLDQLDLVKTWVKHSKLGDKKDVTFNNESNLLLFLGCLLSSEVDVTPLRKADVVSLTVSEFNEDVIRKEAEKALEYTIDQLKGFVKVFDRIAAAKVPVIVHNGLLDLILMYKQFHGSLPKQYLKFKQDVHEMFPKLYDTKQLSFILGVKIRAKDDLEGLPDTFLSSTALQNVKNDLESQIVVLHRPSFEHHVDTPKYGDKACPHEAGYDAFCSGYCFLHLSHIYAMLHLERVNYHRPLSPKDLVFSMKQWMNEIPVQRSGIKCLVLDGDDSRVNRVSWLVVESRNPFLSLSPEAVSTFLATLGTTSVVRRNRRSVMVASPSYKVSEDIIRTFRDNDTFRISRYRSIQHSTAVRYLALSCAILSTGFSTWFLLKSLKKIHS